MVFFFFKFKYFKIVMILLMLNVNAEVCILISDVLPPLDGMPVCKSLIVK